MSYGYLGYLCLREEKDVNRIVFDYPVYILLLSQA
jgi:hypothetical protein